MDVRREGSAFDTLDLRLKQLQGYEGRTGFFEEAKYPDGQLVAEIAAIQEYGVPSRKIPPRPFFRPAIREYRAKWLRFAAGAAKRILDGKLTAADAMESLADLAAEDVKVSINSIWWPKLKKSTLASRRAKGNTTDKPLIDTGLMIESMQGKAVKE